MSDEGTADRTRRLERRLRRQAESCAKVGSVLTATLLTGAAGELDRPGAVRDALMPLADLPRGSAAGLRLDGHPVPDIFLMPPDKLVATLFHTPPPAPPPPPPGAPLDVDAILAVTRDLTAVARFAWAPYLHDPKLERRLRRITAPTLVAAPGDDRLIPVAHAQRYAELIGGAAYATVADCGHAMYSEKPAEFADLVINFCGEHPVNGASR